MAWAARAAQPAAGAQVNTDRPVTNILVVDDEPDMLKVTAMLLEFEGFRVHTAGDGQAALRLLATQSVDLVLTDWMMPTMSGIELCRQLRGDPHTRHIPIILNTSAASTPEGEGVLFDAATSKLTHIETLLAVIHRLLGR